MSIYKLDQIQITDEDIAWVESVIGGNIKFDDTRINVIKSIESIDVQAFPGSGKTTTLVAKLAILAKKWRFPHSGICVLSHTNVAREEIENRLGNTFEGQKLLRYPHFVGTLHSFIDTFIVLPWLYSNGIRINFIDTDFVRDVRWKMLSSNTKSFFERNHKDYRICGYYNEWGNLDWDKQGNTRQELLDSIDRSQKKGLFTFDEMLLLARKILSDNPIVADCVSERFPVIFIDEAQDTNSILWDLIHKAFPNDGVNTIRQGFGDSNQAIYNYVDEVENSPEFPRQSPLVLSESRRFDNRIASLSNTVAVSKDLMNGTNNIFSDRKIPHTIFLFSKEKAASVIDEFAKLILDVFSDDELVSSSKLGCHVVGMVHKKTEETPSRQFPKGIYDYWPYYDAQKAVAHSTFKYFIEYLRMGRLEFSKHSEMSCFINWLLKGLRRIINNAAKENLVTASNSSIGKFENMLPAEKHQTFRRMLLELAFCDINTPEEWAIVVNKVNEIVELFELSLDTKQNHILDWKEETHNEPPSEIKRSKSNCYTYKDPCNDRCITLEFGSIHSVKGRTHLATLVLETYSRAHNIKSILNYLCGKPPRSNSASNLKRLKCQYVAMSRPTALLCLAIPVEFIDVNTKELLIQKGWTIKLIE